MRRRRKRRKKAEIGEIVSLFPVGPKNSSAITAIVTGEGPKAETEKEKKRKR